MIYTIGNTKSYNEAFLQENPPRKVGRKLDWKTEEHPNGYNGGTVFKTIEDAENFLKENLELPYSVYGVLADWEKDTESTLDKDGYWHDLLVTSDLIKI